MSFAIDGESRLAAIHAVASWNVDNVRSESLDSLATRAKRFRLNRLTPAQILVLVLIWLLVVGIPVIQQELPQEAQSVIVGEVGTIGAGLAITQMIVSKWK